MSDNAPLTEATLKKYPHRMSTGKFHDILKIHEKVFLFCK